VLIGLVTALDALGWSHGSRLVARHGWRSVSPLRMVSQFAASLAGVGAVLLGAGIAGVFGAQALASAWLALTLRRRELSERPTKPVRPEVLELRPLARRWGLFILTVALGEIVDKRVEVVLLDAFRSPHEVGVYAVAFSLAVVAMTVPSALAGALIPGIASAAASATDALRSHLLHAARVAWSAGFLLAAGVAAVGPTAVIVFWGSGLREAQQFVPWLALGVLFVPVPVLCGAYWTGTGRLAPVLLTTGVGAVVDLAVAGVLVPPYGIAGAVTANVAAQFVTCALLVGYTQRRVSELGVSAGYLLRCAAVAAVAGLGGWGATAALAGTSPALALLAGIAAFVALVILTGLLVGLVPESDAEWLGGSLPAAARPALVVVGGRRWARSEPAGAVR
jgi:O-antigen/teichoic acid export membrane protein